MVQNERPECKVLSWELKISIYVILRKFDVVRGDVWPNGKALDVRYPLSDVMNMTKPCYSTNQEIHGSIPCTFTFWYLFVFLWKKRQERHDATLLLCSRRPFTTVDKHLAV